MQNKDLIKLLLECPMDMPVLMGLPPEDNEEDIDCWDLNTAAVVEMKKDEKIIMLFWNNEPNPSLN